MFNKSQPVIARLTSYFHILSNIDEQFTHTTQETFQPKWRKNASGKNSNITVDVDEHTQYLFGNPKAFASSEWRCLMGTV